LNRNIFRKKSTKVLITKRCGDTSATPCTSSRSSAASCLTISRKPGDRSFRTLSAGRALPPFLPPDKEGMKKGENSYFFLPSNLFGLLSLASRVFDNNGSDGISAHANPPTDRPTDRPPVEIVTIPRTTTRGRFRSPPPPPAKIYLPRKSTSGTLNSISSREEKRKEAKRRRGTRTEALVSFVLRLAPVTYPRIRYFGPTTASRMALCLVACSSLTYREHNDSIAVRI